MGFERLIDTYRPETLKDVIGQDHIVSGLRVYVRAPYSAGFIFEGATGVGKTSAALALARELGVDVGNHEFGGLHRIPAGEQTGEAVRALRKDLGLMAWSGSGWRVAIIDEADYVSKAAAQVWLDVLESLPPRTLVIFTTNNPDKLPQRFLDRCDRFRFEADPQVLGAAVQRLVDRIWRDVGAILHRPAPAWEELEGIDPNGQISVRRVLQGLEGRIRAIAASAAVGAA